MTEHTPGPWGLATSEPPGQWVIYSKTATGPGKSQSKDVGRILCGEADARLIAAAPALLAAVEAHEAAENARDGCETCSEMPELAPETCGDCFPAFDNARCMRRAAIALARGATSSADSAREQKT